MVEQGTRVGVVVYDEHMQPIEPHDLFGRLGLLRSGCDATRGKRDAKGRSLAEALAVRGDLAAVRLDELPHDCQAEAEPPVPPRRCLIGLLERIEHVREELGRNPRTVVGHVDGDLVDLASRGEPHVTALRSELDGVREQVPHDLLQALGVGCDAPDRSVDLHFDLDVLRLRGRAHCERCTPDRVPHRDLGNLEAELAAVDPAHVEDIVDDAHLRACVALDGRERLEHLAVLRHPARDDRPAEDRVERRPELVGHGREELVLCGARDLGLVASGPLALERLRELLDAKAISLPEEVDEGLHAGAEHLDVERLRDVVGAPCRVPVPHVELVPVDGREEDDRQLHPVRRLTEAPGDLEAVHPRHLHVEEDDREVVFPHAANGLLPRLCLDHLHVERFEDRTERDEVRGRVVDDENLRLTVAHDGSFTQWYRMASRRSGSTGLVTYSDAPAASAFSRSPFIAFAVSEMIGSLRNWSMLADRARRVEAVHLGHHRVHEDDVDVGPFVWSSSRAILPFSACTTSCRAPRARSRWRTRCARRRRRGARACRGSRRPSGAVGRSARVPLRRPACRRAGGPPARYNVRGRRSVNVLPSPGALFTSMTPPSRRAISRLIVRPEARAAVLAARRAVGLLEGLEDELLLVERDADAGVAARRSEIDRVSLRRGLRRRPA